MSAASRLQVPPPDRVYRCAWCCRDASIRGGLLYFTYVEDSGTVRAVPGDPTAWSQSDGICPVHYASVREELPLVGSA